MKGKFARIAIVLAVLVAGMSLAALPGAAQGTITSAELCIFGEESSSAATVNVHQVTVDWAEMTVTWDNRPGYSGPVASFTSDTGWLCVEVTALVQDWVDGTANYGVLLEQGLNGLTTYSSREGVNVPYLGVCTSAGCQTSPAIADAHIFEGSGGSNFGADTVLHTGQWLSSGFEKQSLLRFEIPEIPDGEEGCTPGYWKQEHHFDSWVDYSPGDSFNEVFGASLDPDLTLLEALEAKGPGSELLRHSVAALLNAVDGSGVDYALDLDGVFAAFDAGDAFTLVLNNELGCPLD